MVFVVMCQIYVLFLVDPNIQMLTDQRLRTTTMADDANEIFGSESEGL